MRDNYTISAQRNPDAHSHSIMHNTGSDVHRVNMKATFLRGRERDPWVNALHAGLREELDRIVGWCQVFSLYFATGSFELTCGERKRVVRYRAYLHSIW